MSETPANRPGAFLLLAILKEDLPTSSPVPASLHPSLSPQTVSLPGCFPSVSPSNSPVAPQRGTIQRFWVKYRITITASRLCTINLSKHETHRVSSRMSCVFLQQLSVSFTFLSTPWTFTNCICSTAALESAVSPTQLLCLCNAWPYPPIFFSAIPRSIHHTFPSSVSSVSWEGIQRLWTRTWFYKSSPSTWHNLDISSKHFSYQHCEFNKYTHFSQWQFGVARR